MSSLDSSEVRLTMSMIWPLLVRDSTKIESEIKKIQKIRNLWRKSKNKDPITRKISTSSTKIREEKESISIPDRMSSKVLKTPSELQDPNKIIWTLQEAPGELRERTQKHPPWPINFLPPFQQAFLRRGLSEKREFITISSNKCSLNLNTKSQKNSKAIPKPKPTLKISWFWH